MNTQKKILILEHEPADIELILYELKKSGISFEPKLAQTEVQFTDALKEFMPDIILSDYSLPGFDGVAAFKIRDEICPDTPFIFVSGTIGEENAVELIKNGVTDYALKDKLFALNPKIRRALKEAKEKKEKAIVEEKLLKANNLNAFIGQVNQKIVRVKDEAALFRNSCHLAIQFGKFKMAWIGLFDTENEKISLVEQFGVIKEDLGLFTNAPYRDKGPQDYVLRTGSYFVCNDIQTDLELESWKPYALARGINSCIVLPVKKSGHIIGTFNLYSAERYFLDKEEIELLVEVTEDICFALDLFEKEKKQKATEDLVVKNERRFRALIEKSGDMKTLSGTAGNFIYHSPSVTKVLGYTSEEFLQESAFKLVHPDDLADFQRKRRALLETSGTPFYIQVRFKHKNGNWVWCEGTITNLLNEPNVQALVSNFRDISVRKEMEEKQVFDENNLNALINNTTDLMWSVDRDFNLITSNKPFDEMGKINFGRSILKGESVLDVSHTPEMFKHFKSIYERAFEGESFIETAHFEIPFEFWTEISYYPIYKGDRVVGTACHSRDITEKVETQRKIAKSEEQYRQIVETSQEGIWLIDENNKTIFVNRKFSEILGYSQEEMLGKSNFDLMDEAGKASAKEKIDRRRSGISEEFEMVYITKAGEKVWTKISASPVLDANGKYKGGLAMLSDITNKRKTEQQLIKSEAFNRGVLNSLSSHIAVINTTGTIVATNESWKRFELENCKGALLGAGEGTNYYELCEKLSRAGAKEAFEVLQGIKDVRDGKSTFNIEFPSHTTVEKRWFGLRALKFDNDDSLVVMTYQDISERKLAEEHLIQSESSLNEAQGIAHLGNWEMNFETGIAIWSEEACRIYGLPPQEKIHSYETWVSHIHPEDLDYVMAANAESQRTLSDCILNHRIVLKDGSIKYITSKSKFEFNGQGKPIGLYGISMDVTDRKLAEAEREKMVSNIVQHSKNLEQFASIVSHNLRAPVANILGLANVMKNNISDKDRARSQQFLFRATEQLDDVLKDMVKILQAKSEINEYKERVYFDEIVQSVKSSIHNIIEKEEVRIITDFSSIDKITTIKSYLHSIFYNLISNSIKYRQAGTTPIITIKSEVVNGRVKISFKDNGAGLDLTIHGDKIFKLYQRFHPAIEGKGLGLFMVKTQLETLSGSIRMESKTGEGAEFIIELPL